MNDNLRRGIYSRMNLKDTDELLAIWQKNDRAEWSEDAFEVVRQILQERGIELPEQGQPILEHVEEEVEVDDESYGFSADELQLIDDENPPAFYDPFAVLLTRRQIDQMAKIMSIFILVYNILYFQQTKRIIEPYFYGNLDSPWLYILTVVMLVMNTAVGIVTIYYPLKALSYILQVLMEMEHKSRKAN